MLPILTVTITAIHPSIHHHQETLFGSIDKPIDTIIRGAIIDFFQPTNSPKTFCQTDNGAFRTAVDAYISEGCKTNSACAIGAKYGYPIGNWCTSSITDMSQLFYDKNIFNDDISKWDTSQVTTMYGMFYMASAFNQAVGSWDTSKVTDMYRMFTYASAFNQAVGSWNTGQVQSMASVFYKASSFNQAVGSWNTAQVTAMNSMFLGASAFNQAVGSWDTSQVRNMEVMFYRASSFNQNLCQWRLSPFPYTSASDIFLSSGCPNQASPVSSTKTNWCAVTTCTPRSSPRIETD